MKLEELVLNVGKREIDDREKISIKGALVKPDRKTDFGILFVTGFFGHWEHYMDYFSLEIGKILPIYTVEIRKGGFTYGEIVVNDLCQIDEQVRDRLETNKIIYFGHSLGLPLAVEAAKRHSKQVLGYLGMATYPSLSDCFPLLGRISEYFKQPIAPMAFPIKYANIITPIHFVIAENDEIILTLNANKRKRFENYFNKFPKGSFVVIPGNHCFNQRYFKLKPFNQDNPKTLITKVCSFIEPFT